MSKAKITINRPKLGCEKACEKILRALPEWFGIEQATLDYIEAAKTMPSIVAMHSETPIGFLTLNFHFATSAEIHCMGILPDYHRRGIGHLMLEELEQYLIHLGVQLLQVKTVAEDSQSEHYAKTRKFYLAEGFIPLEVFPTLWDPHNPCLLMVKSLG